MNYQTNHANNFYNSLTDEQLSQIITAITDGRYSWACVLILRFVGYNPLHFIPQRTYSRIMKENKQISNPPLALKNHNSSTQNPSCIQQVSSQQLLIN